MRTTDLHVSLIVTDDVSIQNCAACILVGGRWGDASRTKLRLVRFLKHPDSTYFTSDSSRFLIGRYDDTYQSIFRYRIPCSIFGSDKEDS
jgi:hypothetical protein